MLLSILSFSLISDETFAIITEITRFVIDCLCWGSFALVRRSQFSEPSVQFVEPLVSLGNFNSCSDSFHF